MYMPDDCDFSYDLAPFDDNWEFNGAVNALIEREVILRTKGRVDGYESLKIEVEKIKKRPIKRTQRA